MAGKFRFNLASKQWLHFLVVFLLILISLASFLSAGAAPDVVQGPTWSAGTLTSLDGADMILGDVAATVSISSRINTADDAGLTGVRTTGTLASTNFPDSWYSSIPPTSAQWLTVKANNKSDSQLGEFDITIAFSVPVANPEFHFLNLDAAQYDFSPTTDINSDPVSVTRLAGNSAFVVSGTTANNNAAAEINDGCQDNAGGNPLGRCGSVRLNGVYGSVIMHVTDTVQLPSNGDDHAFAFSAGFDYGDAPNTNNQTAGANRAFHSIDSNGPAMGTVATDAESDGQPSTHTDGDDINGSSDEDGLTGMDAQWSDGAGYMEVTVSGVSSNACLYGWMDWAGDGFGVGTDSVSTVDATNGVNTLLFTSNVPPSGSFPGSVYLRLRLVPETCTGNSLTPTGGAAGGEVEDHTLNFTPTALQIQDFAVTDGRNILLPLVAGLLLLAVLVSVPVFIIRRRKA
jgi:hypothetical protein